MRRLAPLVFACVVALAVGAQARAADFPCGLPTAHPLWIEFSDGSVGFRQTLFGRPGVVVATNGVERAAEMRSLGAHTVYWHMFLKGPAGTPTVPNDPALVQERTQALIEKARASTGCETPLIGLNELFGVSRPTPWPPEVVQYRANVLEVLRMLSAEGLHPFLLVPGQARGPRSPYVGDTAADWWREVAKYGYIVRQMHFNAPYIYGQGPIRGSRTRRIAMRSAITALTSLGIPADRVGLLLGFQSGPGKGGREGLQPSSAWFEIVKRDALAAKQVAAELGVSTIWSWGWGTFNVAGADADKPEAACVYLWTRDPSLCNGTAAAGPDFNASLTEGQIILPAGVHCDTPAGELRASAVQQLLGATGDRAASLSAVLTGLVYASHGGGVSPQDLARGEQAIVRAAFAGDQAAYEAELTARGLNRRLARGIIAVHFRHQALGARLAVLDPDRSADEFVARGYRDAHRSAICVGDEVPPTTPYSWRSVLPFLELPEASLSIAVKRGVVKKGQAAVLSGQVKSSRARETVTVWSRIAGQSSYTGAGTVSVAADGSWTLSVVPTAKITFYRAVSLSAASPSIAVRTRGR
jgi:hypothetical protein